MNAPMNQKLVIVTPIYEDTESAEKLVSKLKDKFQENLFIVAVDDGSINKPIDISILNKVEADGVVLQLIKNVGHQKAIAIGLQYVSENIDWADRVIVMDSDGEDNPDTIESLLKELNSEDIDIAVGKEKIDLKL
jgi:glycosyltransferase involved in cell wall biosynthesis